MTLAPSNMTPQQSTSNALIISCLSACRRKMIWVCGIGYGQTNVNVCTVRRTTIVWLVSLIHFEDDNFWYNWSIFTRASDSFIPYINKSISEFGDGLDVPGVKQWRTAPPATCDEYLKNYN